MHRSCGGFAVCVCGCASGGGGWIAVHYELWATVWVGRFVRQAGATSESWNRYLKHYTTLSYINVLATCSRWLSHVTLDTRVWRFLWAREVVVHHFDEQPAVRLIWPARYNLFCLCYVCAQSVSCMSAQRKNNNPLLSQINLSCCQAKRSDGPSGPTDGKHRYRW